MSVGRTSLPEGTPTAPSGGLVMAPFRGLRFAPDQVEDLAAATSPPYDMVDPEGAARLEDADPHNVIRIIVPRAGDDPEARYRQAGQTLRSWIAAGVLAADPVPGLYVYEQRAAGTPHRGLIGALGLRSPRAGVVLPHEDVVPALVADRLRLTRAIAANAEPILLAYDGGGPASDVVDRAAAGAPLVTTTTADGVTHRLWRVTNPLEFADVAADLAPRQALIADGHHRYATYLKLQAEHHATGEGAGPWDFGLALLVDTVRYPLRVAAIHRVMPNLTPEDAVKRAVEHWRVVALGDRHEEALRALDAADPQQAAFVLAGAGRHWLLTDPDPALVERAVPAGRPQEWRRLDATVLHHVLLDAVWHVPDSYTDVLYRHDAASALAAAARSGGTAVLLRPVPERLVRRLAAAGETMPRKSTSFGPKPRNGLVLRTFEAG